jgi:hypothetical protein
MNDQELRASEFPPTWDNTMRQLAVACPRKLYFFLRGFDYASDKKPTYFVWGAAWEEILATWYRGGLAITQPNTAAYQTQAYLALQMGLELWDSAGVEDKGVNKRSSLEPIWKSYLETYPIEPWTPVEDGAEAGWTFPLQGTPYSLGGALDNFINFPPYRKLILENKTDGGYLADSYVESWRFSPQVLGYVWYARKILGSEVYGCLMNLATKNLPGPRSKWTTPRFKRVIVRPSEAELADFEEHAAWHIAKIKRDHWDDWYWPRSLDKNQCAGGIGLAPCLFKPLCLSGLPLPAINVQDFPTISERIGPWQPWLRAGVQEE